VLDSESAGAASSSKEELVPSRESAVNTLKFFREIRTSLKKK